MKKKILILLVSMALLVGILSGCTETPPDDEEPEPTNNAPKVTMDDPVITHDNTTAGGTVTFGCTGADDDADDVLTYTWDFGDDGRSTDEDPGDHIYAANGSYDVTVTVSDGTDTATATATVLVGNQAPVAMFTYTADNLTVTFTDASTDDGTVSTWSWDYGDGNSSAVQAPEAHTYAADGTYTVTLTVTDEFGLTSEIYSEDITVAQEVAEE